MKKHKWYKICSNCKGKIKYKDEYGFPVYYINEKPLHPFEWDMMDPIIVFCGPECSLEDHERNKNVR